MFTGLVVFSDLDATLLDHQTYSFQAVLPALKKMKERNIPLVLCTSKTRAETEVIAGELGLKHPFIVENGGAIFIPEGYFPGSFYKKARVKVTRKEGYEVIQLGVPYRRLRSVFKMMRKKTGLKMVGFGDLSVKEIASVTGLGQKEAEMAARREYDEPFFLENSFECRLIENLPNPDEHIIGQNHSVGPVPGEAAGFWPDQKSEDTEDRDKLYSQLKELALSCGLEITSGGRFYHLTGKNDKGRAVRILKRLYRLQLGKIITAGLGDSENDWPMLRAVDLPVLVARPDGRQVKTPGIGVKLIRALRPGPAGWAEAVDFILFMVDLFSAENRKETGKKQGGRHG